MKGTQSALHLQSYICVALEATKEQFCMESLQPTIDVGNNNSGWNNGWGSLIGGAIGGAFGSNWNRNGFNGLNNTFFPNQAQPQYLMDTLTTMRTDVDSIARDQLMQTANLGSQMAEGFGKAVSATQSTSAQLAQGQSRTEAAILTTGLQNQISQKDNMIANLNAAHQNETQSLRNTYDIVTSQKDCCCTTQRTIEQTSANTNQNISNQGSMIRDAIHAEGESTRALVNQLDRERIIRESSAKDATIATLQAQQYNSTLQQVAMQQNRSDMQSMLNTLLTAIASTKTTTSTTTS